MNTYKTNCNWILFLLLYFPVLTIAQNEGQLKVTTDPVNAEITIDGNYKGNTPDTGPLIIVLSPGNHVVQVYYKDYEEFQLTINIPPDEIVEKNIELKKVPGIRLNPQEELKVQQSEGKITVLSEPNTATIFIDGAQVNKEPPFTGTLGAGRHNIKAIFEVNDPVRQIVEIEKNVRVKANKVSKVNFDIKEKLGKITVIPVLSNNERCVVYIDNSYVNKTPPFTVFISEGKHNVEAIFTIQKPVMKKIRISRNVFINVGLNTKVEFNILEMTGKLTVNSNQENSEIYVNEQYFGLAPIENALIGTGNHKIVVKKKGYTTFTDNFYIRSRQTSFLNARLKKLAQLYIKTSPPGSNIFVNNKNVHTDSFVGEIAPFKEVSLKVTKPLYEPWEKKIIPKAGEIIKLSADLKRFSGLLKIDNLKPNTSIELKKKRFSLNKNEIKLPIGNYNYKLFRAGYHSSKGNFIINRNETTLINGTMKSKTTAAAALRSLVLPGWGQSYQDKSRSRWLFVPAYLLTGVLSYYFNNEFNDATKEYDQIRKKYLNAFDVTTIDNLRFQMYDAYDNVESAEKMRNVFYGATAAIYVSNFLDVLFLPPGWKNNFTVTANKNSSEVIGKINIPLN